MDEYLKLANTRVWHTIEDMNDASTSHSENEVMLRVVGGLLENPRPGDAGIDLRTTSAVQVNQGSVTKVNTGIRVEIPQGYVGLICPRSGLAANEGVTVVNSPGVIDSNYRGEIIVLLTKLTGGCYTANIGDRIAQLVIVPCPGVKIQQVESLSDSNRGSDGFGSSGR